MVLHSLFTSIWGLRGGSTVKESACNVGDLSSIPGLGRSPGAGNSYPLQYSGLETKVLLTILTLHIHVHGISLHLFWFVDLSHQCFSAYR